MKLYHHPYSPNSRKAVMTAQLLKTDVELVLVDMMTGKHKAPEFIALNPMGRVPVLEDGDLTLWESHAILAYLCDKTPGNTLYPTELAARADVNRWLFWASSHWDMSMFLMLNERYLKTMRNGATDAGVVAFAEMEFAQCAKVLDTHLASRDWVSGKGMTIADVALAAWLMWIDSAKIPVQPYANINKWFAKVSELESWKKTGVGK